MRTKPAAITDFNTWIERLKKARFQASNQEGNRTLISKDGCGTVLEKSPSGQPAFAVQPGIVMGGAVARLVDRGYQKYWQSGEGSLPASSEHLKALHRFEEELRAVMGLTGLYNQSLGTVSARYHYDRVEGREGPRVHQTYD